MTTGWKIYNGGTKVKQQKLLGIILISIVIIFILFILIAGSYITQASVKWICLQPIRIWRIFILCMDGDLAYKFRFGERFEDFNRNCSYFDFVHNVRLSGVAGPADHLIYGFAIPSFVSIVLIIGGLRLMKGNFPLKFLKIKKPDSIKSVLQLENARKTKLLTLAIFISALIGLWARYDKSDLVCPIFIFFALPVFSIFEGAYIKKPISCAIAGGTVGLIFGLILLPGTGLNDFFNGAIFFTGIGILFGAVSAAIAKYISNRMFEKL
jgi:hypothetical protein